MATLGIITTALVVGVFVHYMGNFTLLEGLLLGAIVSSTDFLEVILPDTSPAIGKPIVSLQFPKKAIILLIRRREKYIRPGGSTVVEKGDKLLILTPDKELIPEVYQNLGM